ncbi:MAG TPA: hypothetical protein VG389_21280 [Myxococcota bacterium]|jgi:hypothetical protein|nr:hypothetical protein [Myxococcota bacterium]
MPTAEPFELRIVFRRNPLASADAARALVEILMREGKHLAPTRFHEKHDRQEPLTLELVTRQFAGRKRPDSLYFGNERGVGVELAGYERQRDPGGRLLLWIEPEQLVGHGETLLALALAVCRHAAPLYGWGHDLKDVRFGEDPNLDSTWAPKQVYQAYWLTILGAPITKTIGRERLVGTPAMRVEILKNGAALVVTSPDPGDIASPAAREAQAKALVHLKPELDLAAVRAGLAARSAALGVAAAAAVPTAPPEPDEWRPASALLPPDVDEAEAIRSYDAAAEDLIIGLGDDIEGLTGERRAALAAIDAHSQRVDYWQRQTKAQLEELLLTGLGAYLGFLLVRHLGGRWAPRRNLDESQVVVGDRAWLPFLRARRFLQSRRDAAAHPLVAFYAAAERSRGRAAS